MTITDAISRVPIAARSLAVFARAGLLHPAEIRHMPAAVADLRRYGPFAAVVRQAARSNPNGLGLLDERGELTFADLDRRSSALAHAWSIRGYGADTTIGVLCRDHRNLSDAIFAAAKLGARLLLLNTGFAAPQLADVCAREHVSVLVYDQEFAAALTHIPDTTDRYLAWTDVDEPALPTIDELIACTSAEDPGRPARPGQLVMLTSGTTGKPKGAPRQGGSPFAAAQILERVPLHTGGTVFIAAPLFHGTGLVMFLLNVSMGWTWILRRRFDAAATLELLDRHHATALVCVPTMLQRIVDLGSDVRDRYHFEHLQIVFSAGSALSPDLGNCVVDTFGPVLYNMYGSTEVFVATVATPHDWHLAPGTVGRAPVGCTVRLYDDESHEITEPHVTGRIFVGNGLTFASYTDGTGKPQIDGLLATGDVGHLNTSGLLFVDGRDDEMIVSGGENIYPIEVENLLAGHPNITEAAVVGVPDAEFGQRLAAYVVPAAGAELDPDIVKAHIRANLARHKVPRDVHIITELPRNATGKVIRRELISIDDGPAPTVGPQ